MTPIDEFVAQESTCASGDSGKVAEPALSERDQRILDFERDRLHHSVAKEAAVLQEFGFTLTRYYQVLNKVIDSPAAIVYDPMLVRRLQRLRGTKARERVLLPTRET